MGNCVMRRRHSPLVVDGNVTACSDARDITEQRRARTRGPCGQTTRVGPTASVWLTISIIRLRRFWEERTAPPQLKDEALVRISILPDCRRIAAATVRRIQTFALKHRRRVSKFLMLRLLNDAVEITRTRWQTKRACVFGIRSHARC